MWTPSDITGATDVTTELETFVVNNQGYMIKVPNNAIIKLKKCLHIFKLEHQWDCNN